MPSNTLSVVEEFLRSQDAQQRRNAVTALAVMGDEEAIAQLVKVAISDADDSVRARAEQELLALEGDALDRATKQIGLALDDPLKRQTAYGILGRFRSRGLVKAVPRMSILDRLKLAWGQSRYLYPRRTWSSRLHMWKPGLAGGVIAIAILIVFFLRTWWREDIGGFFVISIITLMAAPIFAIFTTFRANPFHLYLDRRAALLVEVLTAFFLCLLGMVFVLLLLFVYAKGDIFLGPELGLTLVVMLASSVLAGIIRGGTIMSLGLFSDRRLNRTGQIIIGLATGFVFLSLFNFIEWKINSSSIINSILWVIWLPMCIVIANAFAAVDLESVPTRAVMGRLSYIFSLLVLLPLLIGTLVVLLVGKGVFQRHSPNLDLIFDEIASQIAPDNNPAAKTVDEPLPVDTNTNTSFTSANTNTSFTSANTNNGLPVEPQRMVGTSWRYNDTDGDLRYFEFIDNGTLIVRFPEGSSSTKIGSWYIADNTIYLEYGTVKSEGRLFSEEFISGKGNNQGHQFGWNARKE